MGLTQGKDGPSHLAWKVSGTIDGALTNAVTSLSIHSGGAAFQGAG